MTELEKQLLLALEQQQSDYEQLQSEWLETLNELRKMFGITQRENAALSEQVMNLSNQVQGLSQALARLNRQ